MTLKQYKFCIQELPSYSDPDAYASDLSLSSIWEDDPSLPPPSDRYFSLRNLFLDANLSFPDIIKQSGITITDLSARFCIPYRTLHDWLSGSHICSLSTKLMIQEILGLYHPPID